MAHRLLRSRTVKFYSILLEQSDQPGKVVVWLSSLLPCESANSERWLAVTLGSAASEIVEEKLCDALH
jgi:hypothetical protein